MNQKRWGRREFLKITGAGTSSMFLPWPKAFGATNTGPTPKKIRFGLIADIHKDVMHDADQRLQVFSDKMKAEKVDFIMQMGDFCIPIPENKNFMNIWNQFEGPRYHIIGNHDMDGDGVNSPDRAYAFTRDETMWYWDMDRRYYSFDLADVHFVVLDGNDVSENAAPGYRRYIAADQAKWFKKDLAATPLPTLVFIHQSLERENDGAVENRKEIRAIMEDINRQAGSRKVVVCFSGHHHRNYVRTIGGIIYPQINSASYYWVGGDFLQVRYSEEIDEKYPYIKYTVPYKDSLFALVTIDRGSGTLQIEGRSSEFVGPAPWELGKTREQWDAESLVPEISDRKLSL